MQGGVQGALAETQLPPRGTDVLEDVVPVEPLLLQRGEHEQVGRALEKLVPWKGAHKQVPWITRYHG